MCDGIFSGTPGRLLTCYCKLRNISRESLYLNVVIIIDSILMTASKNWGENYINLRKITLFCNFSKHENSLSYPPLHHFVHSSIIFNINNLIYFTFSYLYTVDKPKMLSESILVFLSSYLSLLSRWPFLLWSIVLMSMYKLSIA